MSFKPKMPGVGRGNGRKNYHPSQLALCKMGLTNRGIPWKDFGWTDEQVVAMYKIVSSTTARPKPKKNGPGSGGHNRQNYKHTQMTRVHSALMHLGFNWRAMTEEECIKNYNESRWPKKCKTSDCKNAVKTRNHFYCISCQTSGSKNPAKHLGVGKKISEKLKGRKFSKSHCKNISKSAILSQKKRWSNITQKELDKIGKKLSKNKKRYWANLPKEQREKRLKQFNTFTRPNKCEIFVLEQLNLLFKKDYKYVGDCSVLIGNKNPDFMNVNGQKNSLNFMEITGIEEKIQENELITLKSMDTHV